jgi:hypothetical protein
MRQREGERAQGRWRTDQAFRPDVGDDPGGVYLLLGLFARSGPPMARPARTAA